jgi:hypothetical protein
MSDPDESTSTGDDGKALLSSTFLDFCSKVRKDDPSILPQPGHPLDIRNLSEKEDIKLAGALLENKSITYLQLDMYNYTKYTKGSEEAMAKYVRTSKCLQRLRFWIRDHRTLKQREESLCCFLHAIQESTSLKE